MLATHQGRTIDARNNIPATPATQTTEEQQS